MSTTIDDAILVPVLQAGDKLYHYTNTNGVKGICEGEFWVTESNFLNDKMEFKIASHIFAQIIDEKVSCIDAAQKIKKKVLDEIDYYHKMGGLHDAFAYAGDYVISFSLDHDSTLMWSEYSDFTGYCITFDFERLLNSFHNSDLIIHGMVIYDSQTQKEMIIKTIEKEFFWANGFNYLNSWEDFNTLNDTDLEDCYSYIAAIVDVYNRFYKLDCFSGEKEYRFVFSCGHDGGRFKQEDLEKQYFREKSGVLIPFVKKDFMPAECIDEIMIGPKQNSDIAMLGIKYFLRNLKLDVKIKQSNMPLRY